MRKTIHIIAAARPNFMKVAPLFHALKKEAWCDLKMIHTGQHYDINMSANFFANLRLPEPDTNLEVGSGTHAQQTAGVMIKYEEVCLREKPDLVIVVGDVNSTMACTLVAKKLLIPVAHLEAGLRSGDMTMPEEINRVVTDALADYLWTPSPDADENLLRLGVASERIAFVGNIMMDSFEMLRSEIESENSAGKLSLQKNSYGIVTLHRPSNVDNKSKLTQLFNLLTESASLLPFVFPLHPRTKASLEKFGLWNDLKNNQNMKFLDPLGYISFMSLLQDSKLVITDSGGIQEESTYLGVPCLTLRDSTERPITVSEGTNKLVNENILISEIKKILDSSYQSKRPPIKFWDGKTAGRIVSKLRETFKIS